MPASPGKENVASAGRSFAASSGTSLTPGQDAGAQALTAGLATAGKRAVNVGLGLVFGPVLALFNFGTRDGAGSTNGAIARGIGERRPLPCPLHAGAAAVMRCCT